MPGAPAAAAVYTIPAGTPFADALASELLTQTREAPENLAAMRLLLPTRRACRSLREAFLRRSGGRAMLLPRMTPLGDVDAAELALEGIGIGDAGTGLLADALALPPVIGGLRRTALLARLVRALPGRDSQPDQAAALAAELARLLDRFATERADLAALETLVPEDYARHWQEVLAFLRILTQQWPAVLHAEGTLDPAEHRNRLLAAQAELWRAPPPAEPVIAAGSTGSIPATADLLDVVSRLPEGSVVLPGLDRAMPDEAWEALGPTHPQFGLKLLLDRLGIGRGDVGDWPGTEAAPARATLLSAALLPAEVEPPEPPADDVLDAALDGIERIDCPGAREEASAVALVMRDALEVAGQTCALVTPDRDLARRVASELRRWGLEVDDSAGTPLGATPPGAFLRLVADAAAEGLAPVPLLALLKHPLGAGGLKPADFRRLARALDGQALRGPRPAPGIAGLRNALEETKGGHRLAPLVDRLEAALGPLVEALAAREADPVTLVRRHVAAAEALAATDSQDGALRLWAGDAGEAAAGFVAEALDGIGALGPVAGPRYAHLFEELLAGRVVRPRFGAHPRLHIWGLLEARLQQADVIVLGGLNEGSWPPEPESNPWMSRPMMADLGLAAPERRIGLTAHDFQQAFAARRVVLTRAYRIEGTPTVPSRWLMRLDNLLARAGRKLPAPDAAGHRPWLGWAEALDRPAAGDVRRVNPPKPTPPAVARPRQLSVTQVETLIRDPYAIYARKVLRLEPLEPLDADPGAADRGILIHEAMERFLKTHPEALPDDAAAALVAVGRDVFATHLARPGVRAFWWPRFVRIAEWFAAFERQRRADGWRSVIVEQPGRIEVDGVEGGFTLTAKPDRIDRRAGVGLAVVDYKTGVVPTAKQVGAGLSPQLPLEAAMAMRGAFPGVEAEAVRQLLYLRLSGGQEAGREIDLDLDIAATAEAALAGLAKLAVKFADAETPYLSRPRPQFESRFGNYDHLARVKEWGGEP